MKKPESFVVLFLFVVLLPGICIATQKADFVLVKKSEARMFLFRNGEVFETFKVVFGANPIGHKKEKGDSRTPEGDYVLDHKLEDSVFYKAIRISYPNEADIACAAARGVDPGGRIMIHGLPNLHSHRPHVLQGINWTNGCVAVTNNEMDIIWEAVDEGTPVTILP